MGEACNKYITSREISTEHPSVGLERSPNNLDQCSGWPACQINNKTATIIFSSLYTAQSTLTVFNRRFILNKRQCSADVFERWCEQLEEKETRSLFCKSVDL